MTPPIAVITGATGGMGAVLARRLSADGLRLHLVDVDAGRLESLQRSLPEGTTSAASRLADPATCAMAPLDAPDQIDALVHLAGIFVPKTSVPTAARSTTKRCSTTRRAPWTLPARSCRA